MIQQYGNWVGFENELSDAEIIQKIPFVLHGMLEGLKDFPGTVMMETLQIIFKHKRAMPENPLGIPGPNNMFFKATLGVKFMADVPGEEALQ